MSIVKLLLILVPLTLFAIISVILAGNNLRNDLVAPSYEIVIEPSPTITITPSTTLTASPTPTSTITPKPTLKPTSTPAKKESQTITGNTAFVKVTYYGYPDNSPPGTNIAYPKPKYPTVHEHAGGIGSYDDPISMAAEKNVWEIGTKFYIPYIKKYAVLEDLCVGCGNTHIDLWMNSDNSYHSELSQCQNKFTRNSEVVEVNPPNGRTVSTTPLFDTSTGSCSI